MTTWTTGEMEWANRIATLEHMLAEERENVDTLRARVTELEADRATLLHREVMLKRAHGALTDAGCVVPIEIDRTIEHAINALAQERDEERMRTRCFEQAHAEAEADVRELQARIQVLESSK